MTMMKNKEVMTDLVGRLYPHYKTYKVNSVTPALATSQQDQHLSVLVIGDETVEEMVWSSQEPVEIDLKLYTKDNRHGVGRDLYLSFTLYTTGGSIVVETGLVGDEVQVQANLAQLLRGPTEIGIFLMDKTHDLIDVYRYAWPGNRDQAVLDSLGPDQP